MTDSTPETPAATETDDVFDTSRHIDTLEREAHALARLADGIDPALPVPSCPDWEVRDLLRHVGGIHRWAGLLVRDRVVQARWRNSYDIEYPDDTDDWATFLADGIDPLIDTLRATPPATRVWGWGVDQHARFWSRRLLFETVVHRADAELALGLEPVVDAVLAVEGIEEYLENLPNTARWGSPIADLRGRGEILHLVASDTGDVWSIELTPHGWFWQRGGGEPDAELVGTASGLLLGLQGRPALLVDTGRTDIVDLWRSSTPF